MCGSLWAPEPEAFYVAKSDTGEYYLRSVHDCERCCSKAEMGPDFVKWVKKWCSEKPCPNGVSKLMF